MVNGNYYHHMDKSKAKELMESIKKNKGLYLRYFITFKLWGGIFLKNSKKAIDFLLKKFK